MKHIPTHRLALYAAFVLVVAVILSGCTSTGYSRPPGVYVGPYDLTLNSHREAILGR